MQVVLFSCRFCMQSYKKSYTRPVESAELQVEYCSPRLKNLLASGSDPIKDLLSCIKPDPDIWLYNDAIGRG
jgi:hypothetical protein